jgi:phage terminase large subunit
LEFVSEPILEFNGEATPSVSINSFIPRPYQLPILKALDSGYKRVLAVMPRRSGKDITALNYMIRKMWEFPGVYYYIFPTYAQAKKVIWDSITNEGSRVLDYFPDELIISKNSQEMKIRMRTKGGKESLFQLVGSDNVDSLVGTNPRGCVFSEYALQDPQAYQYISPILVANGGWALLISTPRGRNSMWNLKQIAENSPDWFYMRLTVDDTKHIPPEEIERERREGIMSEDMILQEYYCSFTRGIEGAYYARYMDAARLEQRVGPVAWESAFKVHTAWDLGVRDSTTIIFFQTIGQTVKIIDCYENSKEGIEHYVKVLESKPYIYGRHIAPHDIRVKEWGSGITRIEKARQLGIKFTLADEYSIQDGIEAARSLFGKLWIDEKRCEPLIKSLENYRQEYDSKKRIYKTRPLHDWSSHFADCYRYLAVSMPKTSDELTSDELNRRFTMAVRGPGADLPDVFQDPNQGMWH